MNSKDKETEIRKDIQLYISLPWGPTLTFTTIKNWTDVDIYSWVSNRCLMVRTSKENYKKRYDFRMIPVKNTEMEIGDNNYIERSNLITRRMMKPFWSKITIRQSEGYNGAKFKKQHYIKALQKFQKALFKTQNVYLSAKVTECKIVTAFKVEPHLTINFINYPKFEITIENIKNIIEEFANLLIFKFDQDKIVIEHFDETILLERNNLIDTTI